MAGEGLVERDLNGFSFKRFFAEGMFVDNELIAGKAVFGRQAGQGGHQ